MLCSKKDWLGHEWSRTSGLEEGGGGSPKLDSGLLRVLALLQMEQTHKKMMIYDVVSHWSPSAGRRG